MARKPTNDHKPWSQADKRQLADMAAHNKPTRLIAYWMKRSTDSIYTQASRLGVPLKPTNQSPYNRKR
jgi:uncharacterized protein (DUF934 family)